MGVMMSEDAHQRAQEAIEDRLSKTSFVVRATQFEQVALRSNCEDNQLQGGSATGPGGCLIPWDGDPQTQLICVGEMAGLSVNIRVRWVKLAGRISVLFWEPASRIVDHDMIDRWFDEHCCPRDEQGNKLRADAAHFTQVVQHAMQVAQ